MDLSLGRAVVAAELVAASWLLREGAFVARLRSVKDSGCSGFHTRDEARGKRCGDEADFEELVKHWSVSLWSVPLEMATAR